MDLLDVIVTVMECIAIGFGMEIGAVVAKIVAVRFLNDASPVQVHDGEDDEADDAEDERKKRRRRAARGAGGASTTAAVRAIM